MTNRVNKDTLNNHFNRLPAKPKTKQIVDTKIWSKKGSTLVLRSNLTTNSSQPPTRDKKFLVRPTFPAWSKDLQQDPTTRRLWYTIGTAHDLETHDNMRASTLRRKVAGSHFGHLAVIFLWTSGNLFHVGWQGNFEEWILNPLKTSPIAHAIWDPHFGQSALKTFTTGGVSYPVNVATSGIYHWAYTVGMRTNSDLFSGALLLLTAASISLTLGTLTVLPKTTLRTGQTAAVESTTCCGDCHESEDSKFPGLDKLIVAKIPRICYRYDSIRKFCLQRSRNFIGKSYWSSCDRATMLVNSAAHRPYAYSTFLNTLGSASIAWAGHLVHVAIPASRGVTIQFTPLVESFLAHKYQKPHPKGLGPLFNFHWNEYALDPDSASHIFGTSEGSGTAMLTFLGSFHPQTNSLWLTDIAHHHLAIGVLALLLGQCRIENVYNYRPRTHHFTYGSGLNKTLTESLHFQLGLALSGLGVITSLVAQHMYALPSYAFISSNHVTMIDLYVHHQYIAGFLMVGAFAHGAIFYVRDYDPVWGRANKNILWFLLNYKECIISTLSWVSLFLGFHTLGLYIHNDVVTAFGNPEKRILLEPIFAQYIQAASGKTTYGYTTLLSNGSDIATLAATKVWLKGWSEGIDNVLLTIGPGDFLVHHAISLGVHTSTLILMKGALDARGSTLMPDKKHFGYSFPCDGPGRGGTCDISAWDAFYLAVFWMLNTTSWTTFYFHWKLTCHWSNTSASFNTNSTYLMGWFVNYLWNYSSYLVTGYTAQGANANAVWEWMFLLGHLIWATGFMFLISWRGYWQELLETLVWAHVRTPIASLFQWRDAPVALSIVQARLVGLAHFATGYILTYAPFVTASSL
jgi:photosystem I P700 chlorophyll a apoprotein A2